MRTCRLNFLALRDRRSAAVLSPIGMFWLIACGAVYGQMPLVNEVLTIATSSTGVPVEHDFTISAAGSYEVTLTDLGADSTPSAPLASVALAVSYGDALVGMPLIGAGTLKFTAAATGTYSLHVVGTPGTTPGSGPIGTQVTSSAGGAAIFSSSDDIALPSQPLPNAVGVLNDSFTVATSGGYQVTLTDLSLPQTLGGTLTLLLIPQGGSSPVMILPDNGAMQATVALQSTVTYRIFAIGQAGMNATAGLYSVIVTPAGAGTPAYSHTVPVGSTTLLGSFTASAEKQTVSAVDLAFPAALTQVAVAIVLNGQAAAELSVAGSTSFMATAETYQAFGFATPAVSPGAGSYAVQITPANGPPELSIAQGVSTAGGTLTSYNFNTTVATAGTYAVALHDFQLPSALTSGSLAVVQGAALLGTPVTAPGSFTVKASAGPLTLLAFAEGGQGGSLMDVNLASGAELVFDQPQGVGAAFNAQKFSATTPGNYTVTATDLGFPAAFSQFAVIVTQGSNLLGEIFGAGSLPPLQLTAGNYFANIVAVPASTSSATVPGDSGTYAINVSPSPAAPVVNLTADATSVSSGGTVHLIWTTQNATSCTASGGGWSGTFTGAQAGSDSATSPTITTTATFTLTCQGAGGQAAQSITVNVVPSKGGGALDWWSFWVLAGALVARYLQRRATAEWIPECLKRGRRVC
jgi:hypothetical protein